ncbi:galactosylceramide sulfotransferase-like [Liolophura sinensis]|uniref:galactosylceramide sulfotransferase-like n=1 Tax=Liolophura sinensis TaxID=3198878 RepID=UPI0031583BA2
MRSETVSCYFSKATPSLTRSIIKGLWSDRDKQSAVFTLPPKVSASSFTTAPEKSHSNAHAKCKEKRHVIYVRIPKTGSSTMTYLIWRFGNSRGLRFLLPRPGFQDTQHKLTFRRFYLPNANKYCDLMANHVIYGYANFKRYFPADVVFVSLLREPMDQLYSTIYYLNYNIPGENKVKNYLLDPVKYEPKSGYRFFTHNPMMSYFGLAPSYFRNVDKIRQKIAEVDDRFAMVLILEKFDESLVLLKRKLCWTTNDILYMVQNENRKKPVVNITAQDKENLKNWSMADYTLYEHFLSKLQRSIETEGEDFQQELSLFRAIQRQFVEFCRSPNSNQTLRIASSKFSAKFKVPYRDCQWMATRGRHVLQDIRRQQSLTNFCNYE